MALGWLIVGGILGAGLMYLATRPKIQSLEEEKAALLAHVEQLNVTVKMQNGEIKTLKEYIIEKDRKIKELESSKNYTIQIYDQLINELQDMHNKLSDEAVRKLLLELLQRANQRKQEMIQTIYR